MRCPAALVVSVLSNGGLQAAVEAAGGEVVRTPVGDKYILEGMQVSGAMLGGEKSRPRDRPRAHDFGRRDRHRARGPAGDDQTQRAAGRHSPRRSRCCHSNSGRCKARHKDQWEGDPTLRRAIADATARLGDAGRILVRPSGTEPALRVMVEGPDEALVSELADALATLAGERLN